MGSWLGTGHQKDQARLPSLEFSTLTLHFPGRGKGLENELIDHAYVMKPPQRAGFRVLCGWGIHVPTRRVTHPDSPGQKLPYSGPFPMYLFIQLFDYISYQTLYNKPANVFP